jgi:hypothetical protein
MRVELYSEIVTVLLFGVIAFKLSGRFPSPKRVSTWVLLAVGTIASLYIGPGIELIGIDFAGIYLNALLVGTGLGLIVGFLAKRLTSPPTTTGSAVKP